MAELATLARPYAIAAFDIAKDEGRYEHWSNALSWLTNSLDEPGVYDLVMSPVHSPARKALALIDLFQEQLTESTRRFVHVLADNKRLELLPQIRDEFEQRLAEEQKTLDVQITSAVPLGEVELDKFEDALKNRYQREINLTTHVDTSVLGGALIQAGDSVLDGTVRGKLEKLRAHLQRT